MESKSCAVLLSELQVAQNENDPDSMLAILKNLTSRARDHAFRAAITVEDVDILANTFKQFAGDVLSKEACGVELCTECVRCLRNSCVQCYENQDAITSSEIIQTFSQLMKFIIEQQGVQGSESLVVLLRCCIQCLNNIASGHARGQGLVWEHVLKSSSHSTISLHDDKSTQYTCMLLQTCLTNPECLASFVDSPDAACTMESILLACSDESEHDFTLQFIQMMLRSSSVIPKVYDKLTISSQITLLHIACAAAESEDQQSEDVQQVSISEETLLCFAEKFKDVGHHILSLAMKDSDNEYPNLVMSVIELLCAASAHRDLQSCVQNMDFILETCLELLDMVDKVGRSGKNAFTASQDFDELARGTAGAEESGYGLKRNLVQLIGNMCFRHRGNQDKVRPDYIQGGQKKNGTAYFPQYEDVKTGISV